MKNIGKYKVIGLMSGTSLDGLDIALCHFSKEMGWAFELIAATTVAYPADLKQLMQQSTTLSGDKLTALDHALGKWMGGQVKKFVKKGNYAVDFIASHGHTVFHQPAQGFTLQIGNGHEIAVASGFSVVNDFRALDVALGGQGAPLVPIGDKYLFGEYVVCVNLGGIANLSFEKQGKRYAYDVCFCNMVLNYLVNSIGVPFDDKGQLAKKGQLLPALYEQLNALPYYHHSYPKSLGYEWVEEIVIPLLDVYKEDNLYDVLHTVVRHIAFQIAEAIRENKEKPGRILITGGGTWNDFLISTLHDQLHDDEIFLPEEAIINYKEALIFGFLGVLRIRGEVNCLASVTGASRDNSGGVLFGQVLLNY